MNRCASIKPPAVVDPAANDSAPNAPGLSARLATCCSLCRSEPLQPGTVANALRRNLYRAGELEVKVSLVDHEGIMDGEPAPLGSTKFRRGLMLLCDHYPPKTLKTPCYQGVPIERMTRFELATLTLATCDGAFITCCRVHALLPCPAFRS